MHPLRPTARPTFARRRFGAAVALAVVIVAGLTIHWLLPETPASDIAGDALYAVAVYLFVVAVAPRWSPVIAGALSAAWCVAIELFQLTGIPMALGAEFAPAMLVLGTVFDSRDLLVYPLAIVVAAAVDIAAARARS